MPAKRHGAGPTDAVEKEIVTGRKERMTKNYSKMLKANRNSGRATEAPSIFNRGAFKEAVSRQGRKLNKGKESDSVIDLQSRLRKNLMKGK